MNECISPWLRMFCKVFREEKLIELILKMNKVFKSGGKNLPLCFRSGGKRFKPKLRNKRAPIVSQDRRVTKICAGYNGKGHLFHDRALRSMSHLLEVGGMVEVLREDVEPT